MPTGDLRYMNMMINSNHTQPSQYQVVGYYQPSNTQIVWDNVDQYYTPNKYPYHSHDYNKWFPPIKPLDIPKQTESFWKFLNDDSAKKKLQEENELLKKTVRKLLEINYGDDVPLPEEE